MVIPSSINVSDVTFEGNDDENAAHNTWATIVVPKFKYEGKKNVRSKDQEMIATNFDEASSLSTEDKKTRRSTRKRVKKEEGGLSENKKPSKKKKKTKKGKGEEVIDMTLVDSSAPYETRRSTRERKKEKEEALLEKKQSEKEDEKDQEALDTTLDTTLDENNSSTGCETRCSTPECKKEKEEVFLDKKQSEKEDGKDQEVLDTTLDEENEEALLGKKQDKNERKENLSDNKMARDVFEILGDLWNENPDVVSKALLEINNLCHGGYALNAKEKRTEVATKGGPLAIAMTMGRLLDNSQVQINGINILSNLALGGLEDGPLFGATGKEIPAILNAMHHHIEDHQVQEAGFAALANIVFEQKGHANAVASIVKESKIIASSMAKHSSHRGVQLRACKFLAKQCHWTDKRSAMVASHVPLALAAVLVDYYEDPEVVEAARAALKRL